MNIGIYKINEDKTFNDRIAKFYKIKEKGTLIIREDSHYPLFTKTGEKGQLVYRKELMKGGWREDELTEIVSPERFCIWVLSYSENRLKILEIL